MATFDSRKIIVWERVNKSGKLCPYSPEISQFLEENLAKGRTSVCLGDVDETLRIYSVDLKNMTQKSQITGTESLIKRNLYDCLNVLGRGFSWQWQDDHNNWNSYEVDVNNYIDNAFLEGRKSVSLNKKFPGYNYEIVFLKMIQVNKHSKRKRRIQRFQNTVSYLIENTSDPDSEDKHGENDVPLVLTSEYLNTEVPGTAALENQVNAYMKNVESFSYNFQNNHNSASDGNNVAVNVQSNNEQKRSSNCISTVALVNGRPWTDSRPPHTQLSQLKPVPGIDPLPQSEKPRRKKQKGVAATCPEESVHVLEKYSVKVHTSDFSSEETCIICCDSLSKCSSYNDDTTVLKLTLCSHMFHRACLEAMCNSSNKEFLQCPTCKTIHGEKCGIQPPGEMVFHVLPYSLPGYPNNDTIRIIYNIHSGIQGPNHPNPGHRYTARGFPRHCYLPDNEMGRKILRLLTKAWKRRLIFTIGRSATTGEENTVTWNEIHHKTEFGCNKKGHGYPDPNYFDNILAELEAHGIKDDEQERMWIPA